MRRLIVAVAAASIAIAVIGGEACAQEPAALSDLRGKIVVAYANTFSLWEMMGGAERMYSKLDTAYDVWRNLMSIQYLLEYAGETRAGLTGGLDKARGAAAADPAAHEVAQSLLKELRSTAQKQAQVLGKAREYRQRLGNDLRREGHNDMAVGAADSHAGLTIRALEKLDVSDLIPVAEELVARTKP